MAHTIINNPDTGHDSGGGAGIFLGVILAIILIALFFIYALPALLDRGGGGTDTNINVPERVEVDVNNPASIQ
jgi:hypothetical protein